MEVAILRLRKVPSYTTSLDSTWPLDAVIVDGGSCILVLTRPTRSQSLKSLNPLC